MRGKPNPRRSNGARRDKLRSRVADEGLPCHLCGLPIDYSLPAGDPMSYELDELVPVSKGGDPFSRENVAPAHRICNQRRGNRDLAVTRIQMGTAGDETSAVDGDSGVSIYSPPRGSPPSPEALGEWDLLHMPLPVSQEW